MKKTFRRIGTIARILISLIFFGAIAGTAGVFYLAYHYGRDLPDYTTLANYSPPTVTRLYAADGRMMEEYAKEKRLFVPINAIPNRLVNAFISAEDKNFYTHPGIDISSIFRAALRNALHVGQNKSLVGGSTITQQVVKNFLLSNEKSLDRKIKEAILAFRITKAYSKDKIMELYLNEIYLGNHSYGVAAAALDYFNKSIDELTIEEAAMLAALPKAPSGLDPRKFPDKAKARRDWVIDRMAEEGFIDEVEATLAIEKPITITDRADAELVRNAEYFSEAVRRKLADLYGEEGVYEQGLAVRTTLDPKLQNYAVHALQDGLVSYDQRHGWRGPVKHLDTLDDWKLNLAQIIPTVTIPAEWQLAVVLDLKSDHAEIGLATEENGSIPLKKMQWARKFINDNYLGKNLKTPGDVLKIGDVVAVKPEDKNYALQQIPAANGALVAMDPHNGRVLAMVGGFGSSEFNRAIQAQRQPGSAFKPFVYLAAMENGFAPNSIIVDEEITLDNGGNQPVWKPKNYSGEYYGPTTLRVGVEKSRNAMTVRLAQLLGIDTVLEIAKRFGITDNMQRNFSMVLGAAETNLLSLTNSYAMLVNGGKRITPFLIERVQNSNGKTLYRRDNRACKGCTIDPATQDKPDDSLMPPTLSENREQVSDPIATFQIVSILEGVVQRGTAARAASLGKILAGKTGTTNESRDAWFMGFSADLAVGVYIGFDTPHSLGKHETGASAALPVWMDFMKNALKDSGDVPFRRPEGIKLVKIDATTGLLPSPETPREKMIYEAFRSGTEPTASYATPMMGISPDGSNENSDFGTGGVY